MFLPRIKKGMTFKIKKFLLPTLLAITPFLPQPVFMKEVYAIFVEFGEDEIWSVRKACFEKISELIPFLSK